MPHDERQRRLASTTSPVPGPTWFKVTVETPYGVLETQTIDKANSLVDALLQAVEIPFTDWFPPEDDEEHEPDRRPRADAGKTGPRRPGR